MTAAYDDEELEGQNLVSSRRDFLTRILDIVP